MIMRVVAVMVVEVALHLWTLTSNTQVILRNIQAPNNLLRKQPHPHLGWSWHPLKLNNN